MHDRPFFLDFPDTRRAFFYHVLQGGAYFRTGMGDEELHYISQGASVGVEGHAHQWMDASHVHTARIRRLAPQRSDPDGLPLKLAVGSIDRRAAVLQRLPHGAIILPPDAEPFAGMIRGCVNLMELDSASSHGELATQRRLAEVILLQIIGFARSKLWPAWVSTHSAVHDEFLLRAMTAFFASPGERWTVARLADAAGLSRAAFAERFTRAFGESPVRTINRLRLRYSAEMLVQSNASLGDIALESGFGSAPAYLRAFKREFGMTPGEWRNRFMTG